MSEKSMIAYLQEYVFITTGKILTRRASYVLNHTLSVYLKEAVQEATAASQKRHGPVQDNDLEKVEEEVKLHFY